MFSSVLFNKYFNQSLEGDELEICTDSRKYHSQNIFWCLDGPNFKASDFIDDVAKKGCKNFVVNKSANKTSDKLNLIQVEDSLKSLQDFSTFVINDFKNNGGTVVGLTGSNGKTTNKEILYGILAPLLGESLVSCTKGNFNNHIGVPLTILDLKKETKLSILEMGTNHPGEIKILCDIGRPQHGFITNIGDAHLEFLIDRDGVLNEKRSLYDHCKEHSPGGIFVINLDDEKLAKLNDESSITFSRDKEATYNFELNENEILITGKNDFKITNSHIIEDYNRINLLQCTLFCIELFPSKQKEIIELANGVRLPENNRSTWLKVEGTNIFLDAYNANPSSMEVSLRSFAKKVGKENLGKALVVLGDMNEIGELTQSKHKGIGELVGELGIANMVCIGRYAEFYQEGFSSAHTFDKTSDFKKRWPDALKSYKYIFLKGSRTLQLESLLDIS